MLKRRGFLASLPIAPVALSAGGSPWSPEWDRLVLEAAVRAGRKTFDPAEAMIKSTINAEYHYHTNLRDRIAHPTRDSLDFALLLLEAGDVTTARRIVDRVIALQVTDPSDTWYGIWGWYMEEPPAKMSPADRNWADFLGALLLLIENRHGAKLGPALRGRVKTAILHAARSVERRNVTMSYTNIAVKGTFVTKAAAELLGDRALLTYADERLHRLAAEIDRSGSFAEFNSPTYALVSLINFTRYRMVVKDVEARDRMQRIHDRMWLHFARHWHAATRQFAGPMSRCYRTDLGQPVWLQKALNGRLAFVTRDQLASGKIGVAGELAYLDLRCSPEAERIFTSSTKTTQTREMFIAPEANAPEVQGTTFLTPRFSLGSVNRSSFWVQRRPLLAYCGGPSTPAHFLQTRFVKDDYDFTSAMLYTVQNRGSVLGVVNFVSPGGDKHPSLDPIRDGAFPAREFYLEFLFSGPRVEPSIKPGLPIVVEADSVKYRINLVKAVFDQQPATWRVVRTPAGFSLRLDLIPPGQPRTIRWADMPEAFIVFTLEVSPNLAPSIVKCDVSPSDDIVRATWPSPDGLLDLDAGRRIVTVAKQDSLLRQRLNGEPVPMVRLSDQRLG